MQVKNGNQSIISYGTSLGFYTTVQNVQYQSVSRAILTTRDVQSHGPSHVYLYFRA
jgi:hypothetical protein